MPKRTILVSNPGSVKICTGSLEIETWRGKARVPLEDIWVLILESPEVSITSAALADLCNAGIGTMLCGRNHMPSGLLLPIGAHSRHAAIVEDQLAIPKPLKKRLWQAIVKQKILNQAEALDLMGLGKGAELRELSKNVLSGDTNGREAAAAALYFRELTPNGGRRASSLTPALDYGYAVLRAGIARCAVGGGWLVSRGIHHCSDLNAFNLVDDLIEPFRPVVDLIVKEECEGYPFGTQSKQALACAFSYCVELDGKRFTVESAIEEMLESFKRAILQNDASLLTLPSIIPLQRMTEVE